MFPFYERTVELTKKLDNKLNKYFNNNNNTDEKKQNQISIFVEQTA